MHMQYACMDMHACICMQAQYMQRAVTPRRDLACRSFQLFQALYCPINFGVSCGCFLHTIDAMYIGYTVLV